jgi:hypothetical protein
LALEGPDAEPIFAFMPLVGELASKLTFLPGTGFPFASLKVTVTVLTVAPSAGTLVGLAPTVDTVGETGPGVKTTGVWERTVPSVESVAVNVADSATVEVTVNVTAPEELEVPDAALIFVLAGLEVNVTVLPETGLLF